MPVLEFAFSKVAGSKAPTLKTDSNTGVFL